MLILVLPTIEGPSSPTPLYYIQISCSLTIPMQQWTKFKLMVNFEDPSLKLKDLSVQVRPKEFSHWLTNITTSIANNENPRQGTISGLFHVTCGHIKSIVGNFETKGRWTIPQQFKASYQAPPLGLRRFKLGLTSKQ
jgi:hypothetical protein